MIKTKLGVLEKYIKDTTYVNEYESCDRNTLLSAAARFVADETTYESFSHSYFKLVCMGKYDIAYTLIAKMVSYCILLKEDEQ